MPYVDWTTCIDENGEYDHTKYKDAMLEAERLEQEYDERT